MPNNCFNEIKVYGNRSELTYFKDRVADVGTVFSYDKIKPVPTDLKNPEKWLANNWGAYRYPRHTSVKEYYSLLFYDVTTAVVPPTGIFYSMFEKFPDYSFDIYCYEEFNYFQYEVEFKDGKIIKNITTTWESEIIDQKRTKVLTLEKDHLTNRKIVVEEKIYENGYVPMMLGLEEEL